MLLATYICFEIFTGMSVFGTVPVLMVKFVAAQLPVDR